MAIEGEQKLPVSCAYQPCRNCIDRRRWRRLSTSCVRTNHGRSKCHHSAIQVILLACQIISTLSHYAHIIRFVQFRRRTEELINSVYNKYLYDENNYNANNPNGEGALSYPKVSACILQKPSMPASPIALQRVDTTAIQSKLASYLIDSTNGNERAPPTHHGSPESLVDSGHPSLDQNNSPTNEMADGIYNIENDNVNGQGIGMTTESQQNDTAIASNPFAARPPNKVLLEPLAPPNASNNVPKHLFAAKKLIK